MYIKDEKIEEIKISNRRHDDIVIIIRHDYFIESKKNQIIIEYMNDYGCEFFNIPRNRIIDTGDTEYEMTLFGSILSQKTKQILYEMIEEESNENFKNFDLAYIMRKISNFTMLNGEHQQVLMHLRIFHLKHEETISRKKTVDTMHYYLIIRSVTFEMKLADYRMQFFEKIGGRIVLDQLTNIHNFQSTINEFKMVVKYVNSHKDIDISVGLIEVNKLLHDNVIISSIVSNFMRNTRVEDFIGHFGENKLLVIFYDTDIEKARKPLKRIYNIILADKYIYDHYKNQRDDVISIGFTKLKKGDDIDLAQKRIDDAIANNKDIKGDLKISSM